MDIGLERQENLLDVWLVEDRDVIDAAEGGDDFRALALRGGSGARGL